MDLCECQAEFGDIAQITKGTLSFLSLDKKVCKLEKQYIKDVGLPRAEKRNGNEGVLFE